MLFNAFIATFTRLVNVLLPASCILCGKSAQQQSLCAACTADLPAQPPACRKCAAFLPVNKMQLSCGACLRNPPPFDATYALYPYCFPISHMITALKFKHDLIYAKVLGMQMAEHIINQWYTDQPLPHLIIPVPLHHKRLKQRGFNQSLEIAKPIAKKLSIPIDYLGLKRIKHTLPQSGLSAKKRRVNMKAAFECKQKYDNLCIALIDDVVTTGQTVIEISKTLKKAGAKSIHVWCCARRG